MDEPLISIIVPIYNVEQYLDKCITSIVNQTYKNLEIILVDDGSTDKCSNISDKWALDDNRIKVIHKENGGLSDARNTGLEIATGKYIGFVDSDDFISKYFVEILYKNLVNTQSDLIQCSHLTVDEDYLGVEELINENLSIKIYNTKEALGLLIEEERINQVVWNKLYKKELLQEIHFEYNKLNEDEFFTYQIFAKCKKISYVDLPLYYYLIRNQSIMRKQYSIKRLDGLEAKFLRYEFLKENYYDLGSLAKKNLIFFIIYCYQMVLTINNKKEKKQAEKIIRGYFKEVINDHIAMELNFKEKVWIIMMKISIKWTARLRNKLKINVN